MELTNITFDAVDPERLAAFWRPQRGGGSPRPPRRRAPDVGHGARAPAVSEGGGGKAVKNRMHLDFQAANRAIEVRAYASSARRSTTPTRNMA